MSFGEQGRLQFRNMRTLETAGLSEHESRGRTDCFHDGNEVLKSVREFAVRIGQRGRPGDWISSQVVQLVLRTLLVDKSCRSSAGQLHAALGKIIRNSQPINERPRVHREESMGFKDTTAFPFAQGPPSALFIGPEYLMPASPLQISPPTSNYTPKVESPDQQEQRVAMLPPTLPKAENGSRPGTYTHTTIEDLRRWRKDSRKLSTLRGWKEAQLQLQGRDFVSRPIYVAFRRKLPSHMCALEDRGHLVLLTYVQIFIIDNSNSMRQHKEDVLTFVHCLGYLVKHLDSNGLQVLMTSDPRHKETCSTSTQVRDFVQSRFPSDTRHCNIEHALEQALEDVYQSVPRLASSSKRSSLSRFLNRKPKPFSILVFTDGIWDDSEHGVSGADLPIERCIGMMKIHGVNRTDVAIQFVRFGNDEKGIRRLTFLDDGLEPQVQNKK